MPSPPITPVSNAESFSSPPEVQPIHLILDFDGTITTADTIAWLANVACETRIAEERLRCQKLWEYCLAEYSSALQKYSSIQSLKARRGTIDDEINYQRGLQVIEEESVCRCGESGIFGGVSVKDWREAGRKACKGSRVRITPGFQAMIQKVQLLAGGTGRWGIVSVNWSRDFLKGVLDLALGGATKSESVPVLANNIVQETGFIEGPMCGPAPGSSLASNTQPVRRSLASQAWSFKQLQILNNRRPILTSYDKLEAMKSLRDAFKGSVLDQNREFLQKREDPFETLSKNDPVVVYIGDSLTDLECLLEADVGIIMSPNGTGSLMEALGRNNISVPHISCFLPRKEKSIWFAKDFWDIVSCKLFSDSASHIPQKEQQNQGRKEYIPYEMQLQPFPSF